MLLIRLDVVIFLEKIFPCLVEPIGIEPTTSTMPL